MIGDCYRSSICTVLNKYTDQSGKEYSLIKDYYLTFSTYIHVVLNESSDQSEKLHSLLRIAMRLLVYSIQ